jgi:hypothetical protein
MTRLMAFLFLCLVSGTSSYLLTVRLKAPAEMIDVLPAETLAVVEWDNLAQSWERWQSNSFHKKTTQTHFLAGEAQLGFPEDFIEESKQLSVFLENFTQHSLFHHLFSKKVVLAFLPATAVPSSDSSSLLRHLVLALQIDNDLSLLQSFQVFFGPIQSQQSTIYQGENVVTLIFREGQSLSYWVQQDVLICAQDAVLVQRCIDQSLQRMVREHTGLQLNDAYQRLKQQNPHNADVFFYADLMELQRQLPLFRKIDAESGGLLPRHLALFHLVEEGRVQFGVSALVAKEAMAAFTAQHQLPEPAEELASAHVFQETSFSLWTNWFKPRKLWDFGLQNGDSDVVTLMTSAAQQFTDTTGRPFDTFFDVFGHGFGVFINEQQVPHQSSRSMGCLAIEVRDRPAVLALIKQLVADLQVITVKSGATEISSVMLAGGLLQPAFALVDKYLLLADSAELIEQGQQQIRPYLEGRTKERPWRDGRGGNLFLFVRTGEMIKRLLPFFTLLATENGERTRMLSPENRQLVRELVLPLLADLLDITTTRIRGYAADDTILLEVEYSLHRE